MTIQEDFEKELQALGSKKVRVTDYPQAKRWSSKYLAYTSLSGNHDTFIFLGSNGAVRTGTNPSNSAENPFLKEKLQLRITKRKAQANQDKATEMEAKRFLKGKRPTLTMEDLKRLRDTKDKSQDKGD